MCPAEGAMMNFTSILAELKSQRARIETAIAAIQSLSSPNGHTKTKPAAESNAPKRRRSRMSATARRKLSLIMKKRWAQRKMKKKVA
jgi:hypothetical protein